MTASRKMRPKKISNQILFYFSVPRKKFHIIANPIHSKWTQETLINALVFLAISTTISLTHKVFLRLPGLVTFENFLGVGFMMQRSYFKWCLSLYVYIILFIYYSALIQSFHDIPVTTHHTVSSFSHNDAYWIQKKY